jgi:hypothetical protein
MRQGLAKAHLDKKQAREARTTIDHRFLVQHPPSLSRHPQNHRSRHRRLVFVGVHYQSMLQVTARARLAQEQAPRHLIFFPA